MTSYSTAYATMGGGGTRAASSASHVAAEWDTVPVRPPPLENQRRNVAVEMNAELAACSKSGSELLVNPPYMTPS
ncbi:hypothetical protein MKZ38_002868 [Zalerion maritima]|uniref:Uncharacterized protein n=1 Tax=Zalerion maritima TaxID=339359 RepID=A0AAD5S4Z6_9PEZI|nr:hypothetical protein MKZ38_002868 [Zalerion maritima]